MRQLKVLGINIDGTHRCIVAAQNQKEAAGLLGITVGYLATYGCETGNDAELDLALSTPRTVYIKRDDFRDTYRLREST